MKYVISVAKAYKHRGKRQHYRAKKHWFVYYYDEHGSFHTQRVNLLQTLYYKTLKRHRYKVRCSQCGSVFMALIWLFRDKLECPYCSS